MRERERGLEGERRGSMVGWKSEGKRGGWVWRTERKGWARGRGRGGEREVRGYKEGQKGRRLVGIMRKEEKKGREERRGG